MRRAGELKTLIGVYSALFGGREESVLSSTSSRSCSLSSSSGSRGLEQCETVVVDDGHGSPLRVQSSLEADEVEDQYGSAESNNGASSSSSGGSRAIGSDADGHGRRAPREGETQLSVEVDSRGLGSAMQLETAMEDDGSGFPDRALSSGFSRRGFGRRGASRSRATTTAKVVPTRPRGLKEVQLEKLGRLEALDRAWDKLYPTERDEEFEWPWETLSEQQVALGQLDFRKFIVLLSALSQTGLQPESALCLEQINALHRLPLEDVPEYIAREVAISHKIPDEFFSNVKDIKRTWLEEDEPVSFECHVDNNDVCKFKIVQQRPASTVLHRTFGGDRVMLVFLAFDHEMLNGFRRVSWLVSVGTDYGLSRTLERMSSRTEVNRQTFDTTKNKPLSFTNGAGEMSLAVAKLFGGNHVVKGRKSVDKEEYPSLIQHRTYKLGMALKGTYQINYQLEGLKIRNRPSMTKVDDKNRLVLPIIDDTLEILNTSRNPKEANLCQDLIILLSFGGVPADFLEQLVRNALENIKNVLTDWDLALERYRTVTQNMMFVVMRRFGCWKRDFP